MSHPTKSRLEWGVACLTVAALAAVCLLACLAGGDVAPAHPNYHPTTH